MSYEMEDILKHMFREIQEPFALYKEENRRNFLSCSYIAYKLCQIMNYNEFLPILKLYKDKAKTRKHDITWEKMCNHLGWRFIKT